MLTRRQLLKAGALSGVTILVPGRWHSTGMSAAAASPGAALSATDIPKYVTPLVLPPAMPRSGVIHADGKDIDYYQIAVRQFRQQILPDGMGLPPSTVWGYGSVDAAESFNYPAFTIEARAGRPVRVQWINDLVDPATGRFLPHLLPVDPTLHWANPPGGLAGRDSRPAFDATPGPYRGPVPIVTHLHGGHNSEESDGFAEAWYLPAAANIPAGYATDGTWYDSFRTKFEKAWGIDWKPGTATFQYANTQRPATLWFHDHTLGLTRLNVYAGPAGFYLLRGGAGDLAARGRLPGPAPARGDPPGLRYHEIPIVIQDRSFTTDASLRYPSSRKEFDGFGGPYVPGSDIAPIWNPEVFGDAIVVNGRTWPFLEVEPRRYRFRFLNGCDARFLILRFDPHLPIWQIGNDGGFLPEPVERSQLLLAPAERADVIVDFAGLRTGAEVRLLNLGPDEPFGGPDEDFDRADPATTGQVLTCRVVPLESRDRTMVPDKLELPPMRRLGAASKVRRVSLNEAVSEVLPGVGPSAALLGTVGSGRKGEPLGWDDAITENPALGATEVWEIHNFTVDAHPIHIHEVQFEVRGRRPFGGNRRPPEPGERGFKDTVIAYPGEVTRVRARFDLPGLYAWHCHILEHEDNEMMRPYRVGPAPGDPSG